MSLDSLEKIVLEAEEPITASDVAEKTGEPATAVRLQLRTLADRGKIEVIEMAGKPAKYWRKGGGATPAPAAAGRPAPSAPRALSVEDLLADANAEPERRRYGAGSEYMEVVHVLKTAKRLAWKEIAGWFKAKGIEITGANLASTYKKWLADRQKGGKVS